MATVAAPSGNLVACQILDHLLDRLDRTATCEEPYSHFYLDSVFPDDVYAAMMAAMPAPGGLPAAVA